MLADSGGEGPHSFVIVYSEDSGCKSGIPGYFNEHVKICKTVWEQIPRL